MEKQVLARIEKFVRKSSRHRSSQSSGKLIRQLIGLAVLVFLSTNLSQAQTASEDVAVNVADKAVQPMPDKGWPPIVSLPVEQPKLSAVGRLTSVRQSSFDVYVDGVLRKDSYWRLMNWQERMVRKPLYGTPADIERKEETPQSTF